MRSEQPARRAFPVLRTGGRGVQGTILPLLFLTLAVFLTLLWGGCSSGPAEPPDPGLLYGSVDITCLPTGLGAPWTLVQSDQTVAVGYGDSLLSDLPLGEQLFVWGLLPGWNEPHPDTLRFQVIASQTDSLVGTYEILHDDKGKVTVFPLPVGLAAPWTIAGQGMAFYRGEGTGELWLPVGDYTFSWGFVPGYLVPQGGPLPLNIQVGIEQELWGSYHDNSDFVGNISIDADPDSLHAGWSLLDPAGMVRTGQGDAALFGLQVGLYTLTWLGGSAWELPHLAHQTGDLAPWGTLVFRGDYLSPEPLAVAGLEITNGYIPGQVDFAWMSTDNVVQPMVAYLVLAIPEQTGAAPDWDQARVLARISPRGPGTEYHYSVGPEAELVAGVPYRFTVRGQDTGGRLSPVQDSAVITVEQGFLVSGILTDHLGEPLAGIPLEVTFDGMTGPPQRVTTDELGAFSSFALWIGAVVHIRTFAGDVDPWTWYDYISDPLENGEWENMRLALIPRRGVDPACPQYDGSFLTYIRTMTNTTNATNNRPNTLLHKWDHFPLAVYIPDYLNGQGLDMGELCRTAPGIWNDTMGEDYYVLVANPDSADVVFRFGTDRPSVNGQASILLPAGSYFIGDVIPEKMEVYIAADMGIATRVQEVALHELGHTLGIANHSLCAGAGYLMYISSAGALDNGPANAIHPDEIALAQCLRHLPQGVDMAGFGP